MRTTCSSRLASTPAPTTDAHAHTRSLEEFPVEGGIQA